MDDRDDRSTPTPGEPIGDRLGALEAELAGARDEAERFRERWVRERADLENVKKRAERERLEAVRFGTERLVHDLLSVVDDLERALVAAEGSPDQGLLEGVRLVYKSLLDVLARHGVSRVESHGRPFDPAHHEAIAHVESPVHGPGTVIEEHRGGYRLNERLLRPALVTVSKGDPAAGELANEGGRD